MEASVSPLSPFKNQRILKSDASRLFELFWGYFSFKMAD